MSSPGRMRRSSRTAVRPPRPESNTPMAFWAAALHMGGPPGALKGKANQLFQKLAIALPGRYFQLGVHADIGKARHGVHFVQKHTARAALYKEIHARKPAAAQRAVGLFGRSAHGVQR